MTSFVIETSQLEKNGIKLKDKLYQFRIHSFVCDVTARSFLKNTKLYSGYYSCDCCIQSGKHIGRVTDFVLDYMHLVCLGVMRKLLQFWVKGPLKTRLTAQQVMKISEHQKLLSPSIPNEFARKPLSLTELDHLEGN